MANKTLCKLTTRLIGIPHYVLTYKVYTDDTHFVCFTFFSLNKADVYEEYIGMKQESIACTELKKEFTITKVTRKKTIVLDKFSPLVV